MSDKDYSGCEFYKKGETFLEKPLCNIALYENFVDINLCNSDPTKSKYCKDNPNCHYKQLQASKDECDKKDNQIKILKEKTLIYHSCKTLIDENTALNQQLDISVEALEKILDKCIYFDCLEEECTGMYEQCSYHIAKIALDKVKEK